VDTRPAPLTWVGTMPALFVLLWSTGFIGAKLGLPYTEPFTFLLVRFTTLAVILVLASLILRAPWPKNWAEVFHLMVSGLLVHGVYLGAVFYSISIGLSTGITALIVGMQPLLTALVARSYLGEQISPKQWTGLILGFCGIVLVVTRKIAFNSLEGVGVVSAAIALVGITLGVLYQKRHCSGMDLRSGSAIQFIPCVGLMAILASLFESMEITWTGQFVFALVWLVVVLSLGAITLLYILIHRGAATQVASLFYLVPPVVAVLGYFLFGEELGWIAIIGMAVAVLGVALVTADGKKQPQYGR